MSGTQTITTTSTCPPHWRRHRTTPHATLTAVRNEHGAPCFTLPDALTLVPDILPQARHPPASWTRPQYSCSIIRTLGRDATPQFRLLGACRPRGRTTSRGWRGRLFLVGRRPYMKLRAADVQADRPWTGVARARRESRAERWASVAAEAGYGGRTQAEHRSPDNRGKRGECARRDADAGAECEIRSRSGTKSASAGRRSRAARLLCLQYRICTAHARAAGDVPCSASFTFLLNSCSTRRHPRTCRRRTPALRSDDTVHMH